MASAQWHRAPGDDLLPSGAPLTSNSADSMTVSPSATADTER
jgi:hypothetical protein